MNTPIDRTLVDNIIRDLGIADFSRATIREVKAVAAQAEAASGVEFVKMEMGVPGLPPAAIGVEAEVEALRRGVASLYPDINGERMLKEEASRFVKAFVGVDVAPEGCVPVTGSMQGTFASSLTCTQCREGRDTVLFIDPGFPVQKQQLVVMGARAASFDVYLRLSRRRAAGRQAGGVPEGGECRRHHLLQPQQPLVGVPARGRAGGHRAAGHEV